MQLPMNRLGTKLPRGDRDGSDPGTNLRHRDGSWSLKFREVRRMLRQDGWRICRQEGSHEQYRHRSKKGRVTVAGHDSSEVPPGTLRSIMKQAGLG